MCKEFTFHLDVELLHAPADVGAAVQVELLGEFPGFGASGSATRELLPHTAEQYRMIIEPVWMARMGDDALPATRVDSLEAAP